MKENMTNIVHIVAAVVDTAQVTFYKQDGSTLIIPQGDPRLAVIVRQITPVCARGEVAEIDMDAFPDESARTFIDYEERSGGVIKFLRIAKNKLASFFGSSPPETVAIPEQEVGLVPIMTNQLMQAIEEIAAHAKPVSAGIDRAALEADDETVVAVMGNTVIPDVHKLETQFKRSNEQENTIGMQRFMERVAAVAAKRSHSVQDLMRFMQRGDLPVAEDGCIVIYKILRKRTLPAHSGFTYVDVHSGNVPQRVGAYVHMDESLVDMNRNNECSNGLHVARRGYLGGFRGDVVTICKVRPEDVIAVPAYDANKMRVCGYHIISELSKEDYATLCANKPLTSTEGLNLLAQALSGSHPAADTEVKITAQKGGGIVVTELKTKAKEVKALPEVAPTVLETEVPAYVAEKVDVHTVSDEVSEVITTGKSRAEVAAYLYGAWDAASTADKPAAAKELIAFKKSKKLGWEKLGISHKNGLRVEKDAAK